MNAGLDIGGANIKIWREDGKSLLYFFPVWKHPEKLADCLDKLLKKMKVSGPIAITMTAELCDCFSDKKSGVISVLESIPKKFHKSSMIFTNHGKFVSLQEAKKNPLPCAASNWLAMATYVGKKHPKEIGFLLDMGSTTTDIIPVVAGKPESLGYTDRDRLKNHELVYTGMRRSPLSSLLGRQFAQEWFASTSDAHLILGNLVENRSCKETADGKPFTVINSERRIARMICEDMEALSKAEIKKLAIKAVEEQTSWILNAVQNQIAIRNISPKWFYLCGEGEVFLKTILRKFYGSKTFFSFSSEHNAQISECSCAFSVGQLAKEKSWKLM